jgi:hypothetical protein
MRRSLLPLFALVVVAAGCPPNTGEPAEGEGEAGEGEGDAGEGEGDAGEGEGEGDAGEGEGEGDAGEGEGDVGEGEGEGEGQDTTAPAWGVDARLDVSVGIDRLTLSWTPATDDVGPVTYRVYADGVVVGDTADRSLAVDVRRQAEPCLHRPRTRRRCLRRGSGLVPTDGASRWFRGKCSCSSYPQRRRRHRWSRRRRPRQRRQRRRCPARGRLMLGLPPTVRIHFAVGLVDMRKGIDGLRTIVDGVFDLHRFFGPANI